MGAVSPPAEKIGRSVTDHHADPQYSDVNAVAHPDPPPPRPSLTAIYRDNFRIVWSTLARLGVRRAELEDATQEVFLVVHRRLPDYDPRRPIRPWLLGITYRVATAERRRARHHREELTDDPRKGAVSGNTPEAEVIARRRADRIHRALQTLDPERRAVFVMYEMQGVACTEIAEALGIPVNTAYSRLRVARERFRRAIDALRTEGEVS